MLCLTRKRNGVVLIGNTIIVKVLRVIGDTVELGFEAPKSVKILRGELEPFIWEERSNDSTCFEQEARGAGSPQEPRRDHHRGGQGGPSKREKGQPHHRGAA